MKPLFHPRLVNGPCGDPALYVEFLFEGRALLFDMGSLHALPGRQLLRVSDVFVSHAHMDHLIGFDHLLRICLGRDTQVRLYGPPGFCDRIAHKLAGYTWNLVQNYRNDFTVAVTELHPDGRRLGARFRCQTAFEREDLEVPAAGGDVLLDEPRFRVRGALLDHRIPSLAFALEEKVHVNVWKNRLDELGLPTGAWLRELKEAVLRGAPDATPFRVWWRADGRIQERMFTIGELSTRILRRSRGQKIAYITDAVYHEANAARMAELARGADLLFIESAFLDEDADQAAAKYHLTAGQAGTIAARAGAGRFVTFHHSARYQGDSGRLQRQALAAFERSERRGARKEPSEIG